MCSMKTKNVLPKYFSMNNSWKSARLSNLKCLQVHIIHGIINIRRQSKDLQNAMAMLELVVHFTKFRKMTWNSMKFNIPEILVLFLYKKGDYS